MNINENTRHILTTLKNNGHQAVLAGGCVRDFVLGLEPNDWDIATSANPSEIAKIFPRTVPVGKYFGVMTVLHGDESFEVATFRTDGEYKNGRKPTSVRFASIKEDASRRDLTINGMFYDLELGIIDYVGGQIDLASRVIRFIGSPDERIQEDHLRILRALRFAHRLQFRIDLQTLDAIEENAYLLRKISAERIRDELDKMFSYGRLGEALTLLADTGVLKYILPEVEAYRGCAQNPKYHPEGDVWNHTIAVVNNLPEKSSKEAIWGAVFHDVGKPRTSVFEDGEMKSPMHEAVGEEMTRDILFRLKFPNSFIDSVCYIVGNHMMVKQAPKMRLSKIKKLLSHENANDLISVSYADSMSGIRELDWFDYINAHIEQWKKEELRPKPLLTGADLISLGMKPSPTFGVVLSAVYDEQLENNIASKEDALIFAKSVISKIGV